MAQGAKKAVRRKTADPYKLEVATRIYDAFVSAGRSRQRGNELTQDEVGRLVARELKQKESIPQATVSRWMSNRDPALPDPLTLRAIQAELIDLGATPEMEEFAMTQLRDRQLLAKFSGGSSDDEYTEADVLMAINNLAEAARRFLSGPTL